MVTFGPPTRTVDFKLLSLFNEKVPKAQTVKSILKSSSAKPNEGVKKRVSFNRIVKIRTQIFEGQIRKPKDELQLPELPELFFKSWNLPSNHQSKLQTLQQHKICLEGWKKDVYSSVTIRNKMQSVNNNNHSPQQVPPASIVLETPKSRQPTDSELNSSQ